MNKQNTVLFKPFRINLLIMFAKHFLGIKINYEERSSTALEDSANEDWFYEIRIYLKL